MNSISERLLLVKINVGNGIINIISTYSLQAGLDEITENRRIWDNFNSVIGAYDGSEMLVVRGDMNSHAWRSRF